MHGRPLPQALIEALSVAFIILIIGLVFSLGISALGIELSGWALAFLLFASGFTSVFLIRYFGVGS